MNRPLVALGLMAVALSLLTVLVADMQQAVENPEFDLSEKGADAAAKAADKLGPEGAEAIARHSDADALQFPDGATVTLPEGTEIDGDLIRLAQEMAWTLPAGAGLENLSMELPAGVGFEIPEGTWADGDTLVFPPGSTLRLDDGTELTLPDGGRLTMPGASTGDLSRMIQAGHGTTREGSTFSAPLVRSEGDWPVVFPPGTEFTLPEGMELPQGKLGSDTDVSFPPGSEIKTSSQNAAGDGSTLFDKIGDLDLTGKDAASSPSSGGLPGAGALPGTPGGWWWVWGLVAAALIIGAWFAWRYRDRLRGLVARSGAGPAGDAPVRLSLRIDDRPADLPLAMAPGAAGALHVGVLARARPAQVGPDGDATADPAPRSVWRPSSATIRLLIDGKPWTTLQNTVTGQAVPIPRLAPGTHTITAHVDAEDAPGTHELTHELHVAPWNEQVARDYQRLYERALATLDLPDGVTPRMLADAIRARSEPEHDAPLDGLIRTFETANYGHAEIDLDGWVRFVGAVDAFIALLDTAAAHRPRVAAGPAPEPPAGATTS